MVAATASATKVKSRVWRPSPKTVTGRPAAIRAMKLAKTISGRSLGPYTVKYRSETADRPLWRRERSTRSSAAPLGSPYGDTGRRGGAGWSAAAPRLPDTPDDEARRERGTARRAPGAV